MEFNPVGSEIVGLSRFINNELVLNHHWESESPGPCFVLTCGMPQQWASRTPYVDVEHRTFNFILCRLVLVICLQPGTLKEFQLQIEFKLLEWKSLVRSWWDDTSVLYKKGINKFDVPNKILCICIYVKEHSTTLMVTKVM